MVLAGITSRTKAARVGRKEMRVTEYRGTNFRKLLQERESLRGKKKKFSDCVDDGTSDFKMGACCLGKSS